MCVNVCECVCRGQGPAAAAGMQEGDVIVAVNGMPTTSAATEGTQDSQSRYDMVVEQLRTVALPVTITVRRGCVHG